VRVLQLEDRLADVRGYPLGKGSGEHIMAPSISPVSFAIPKLPSQIESATTSEVSPQ